MAIIIKGKTVYGPSIVRDGLVLYLDAANKKSYPGTGNIWHDLSGYKNNCVFNSTPSYFDNYFSFNGISSGITVNKNISNDDLSIEYVIFNSNENGLNRFFINSSQTSINLYGSTNTFYFLRKVNDTSASFGDSIFSGYTGVSFDVELNDYNFITITHNSVSGTFKVYKNGELYKNTDGFYNNTTGQSTGYSGLVGNTGGFKIGQ